jgi:D-glycero-D-manno-heptose 1,7-bisphosphate phosphatase
MAAVIEAAGGRVDGWFYCPHHPEARVPELKVACGCRKPRPGMIEQAARRFQIDLAGSFVVGDKIADVDLGLGVGARSVLVKTGYGEAELVRHGGTIPGAAHVAEELMGAVSWILAEAGFPKEHP